MQLLLIGAGTVVAATLDASGAATGPAKICEASSFACDVESDQPHRLRLTATPEPGSVFVGWGDPRCGRGPVCTLSVARFHQVTAVFAPFRVSVSTRGRGTATLGDRVSCPPDCAVSLLPGAQAQIRAVPDRGERVLSWLGCDAVEGTVCTVTAWRPRSVVVFFTTDGQGTAVSPLGLILKGRLAYGRRGGTGRVVNRGRDDFCARRACRSKQEFVDGDRLTLVAKPKAGYRVVGWRPAWACLKPQAPRRCSFNFGLVRQMYAKLRSR